MYATRVVEAVDVNLHCLSGFVRTENGGGRCQRYRLRLTFFFRIDREGKDLQVTGERAGGPGT